MNELLQKHGCANVFTVPEGLRELMSDISREVLRDQPPKIFDYIANYLSVLLITREHGILAVRILDDLCDCKPSVSEHLLQLGIEKSQVDALSQVIKEEIETVEPIDGKEKVKETQIMKKILAKTSLDEEMTAKVCQVARNAYRDYWYRKKLLEKSLKMEPSEAWEVAAERTLQLYKKTKPSYSELSRATEKIQAAYRGYYIRRNLLRHLKPKKKKKTGPKVELPGPPLDIAASREIDLGPVINVRIREDDVGTLFDTTATEKLGLHYDPRKTITHLENEQSMLEDQEALASARRAQKKSKNIIDAGSKHARMSSQILMSDDMREPSTVILETAPSHVASHVATHESVATELHKISFSEVPPEVIPPENEEIKEVPEEPGVEAAPAEVEVPPEIDVEPAQEVPEDIPERSEGDGESVPTASVPSSAPDTANTTDVEDEGDGEGVDTAEEEGEE